MLSQELKDVLTAAANKYETADFIASDPVQFPHRYSKKSDIEIVGLLTALLSFGNRKQILAKANRLCEIMGASPTEYILRQRYVRDFPQDDGSSFYRMVSYADFRGYMDKLHRVYSSGGSLETRLRAFPGTPMEKLCASWGVSAKSPQKKLNMFLRWMVRRNSPVDFGIWRSLNPGELVIPLDTHVSQMAREFGITSKETYSLATAKAITASLGEAFPGDPVRGDFALFGIGIEKAHSAASES